MSHTSLQDLVPVRQPVADPHRPQYHFTAPAGWLNDPNGLIQWGEQYHIFYQHNPQGPFHGGIHWGHAVSDDLVHWRDLPIALAPTPGGADAQGCWSGCAVDNDGTPALVYTGVLPQVVNLATSSDDLLTWQKYAGNPVIAGPPPELSGPSGGDFRDPFVWRAGAVAGDGWYMVMGTRAEGIGGLVLLYRSDDLLHWEYLNPLLEGDAAATEPFATGVVWECPNLLDFGERQALLVSAQKAGGGFLYPFYVTGAFSPTGFVTETQGVLVYGGPHSDFYAPQVMRRRAGSYLLWGWLQEGRSQRSVMAGGWAGALSIPLSISPAAGGRLQLRPADELQSLRREHWHFEDLEIPAGADELLPEVLGDSLEIVLRLALGPASEAGLDLRCSPDRLEYTRIIAQPAQRRVLIEREHASLDPEADREPCRAPLDLAADQVITLHVFLDHSVLEVFVDDGHGGQTNLASRIYPVRPDSVGLGLFSGGSSARVLSLDVWRLASIW